MHIQVGIFREKNKRSYNNSYNNRREGVRQVINL